MRDDISEKLVHLTKGTGNDQAKHREQALIVLAKILKEKKLNGGTGYIKGSHKCVCFSEAPISKLSQIIAAGKDGKFKYQPYGVIVDKRWLYIKGGRPVIYGPDPDYSKLPEEMRYRHVRFHLSAETTIDHTWEREWRIKTDELTITPDDVTIVVPDRRAKNALVRKFPDDSWHYIVLSDLGVTIDALKA